MSENASDQVVIGFIVQSTLHKLIWNAASLRILIVVSIFYY